MIEDFYKDMTDYFVKNKIESLDDWGIEELAAFGWGLQDWLREKFPYFDSKDISRITNTAMQVIGRRLKDGIN